MKLHLTILLFIFSITFLCCQSKDTNANTLTLEELKIKRAEVLIKQRKTLKHSKKSPKLNNDAIKQIDDELSHLAESLCKNSKSIIDCSECNKCNSGCSLEDRINASVNCFYKKGVVAGGSCNSCPTIPIKNLLIRNNYTITNNIVTKITFINPEIKAKTTTITLGNKKNKATKKSSTFSQNIEELKINTSQKYDIVVEEIMPDKTIRTFTIKNYTFNRKQ